jgi:DNA-directed RNA polymerase I subunit RPA12
MCSGGNSGLNAERNLTIFLSKRIGRSLRKVLYGRIKLRSLTTKMAAIGSLVFCTDCGNLLEQNVGKKTFIQCDICGTQNKGGQRFHSANLIPMLRLLYTDTSSKVVITTSKPDAFPSTLRTRLKTDLQEVAEGGVQTDVGTKETCGKCGSDDARYYELQLRSADEGSTIFYTCQQCGNKWRNDN